MRTVRRIALALLCMVLGWLVTPSVSSTMQELRVFGAAFMGLLMFLAVLTVIDVAQEEHEAVLD